MANYGITATNNNIHFKPKAPCDAIRIFTLFPQHHTKPKLQARMSQASNHIHPQVISISSFSSASEPNG
jgi:hypothetical protein